MAVKLTIKHVAMAVQILDLSVQLAAYNVFDPHCHEWTETGICYAKDGTLHQDAVFLDLVAMGYLVPSGYHTYKLMRVRDWHYE